MIEIENAWQENYFVTKANLFHERVHTQNQNYSIRGKRTYTSVSVFNDSPAYNLYGVVDCLEIGNTKNDVPEITIVEYKPTQPKNEDYHFEDAMQVFAQKICADNTLNQNCQAVLYYINTKKRIVLPFDEQYQFYNQKLVKLLEEMRVYLEMGRVPAVQSSQKCNGCSFQDLCLPPKKNTAKRRMTVKRQIEAIGEDVL